jgi:hypothetical protein
MNRGLTAAFCCFGRARQKEKRALPVQDRKKPRLDILQEKTLAIST